MPNSKPEQILHNSSILLERSRGVFIAQWEELLRLRRIVMKTSDLDDIHDLRVASRRLRAALELFEPVTPRASTAKLKKNVRRLTRNLGGLRNIDEALLFFQSRTPGEAAADNMLQQMLSKMRPKEFKRIKKTLVDFDHRKLDRIVRELVEELNEGYITAQNRYSLPAYFSNVSIRLYQPIHRLLAVSTAPDNRAPRHALRIAIKKWRYFFEIIVQVLNCENTLILGLLKEYQSLLGRMNDIAEFEILLGKLDLPPDELAFVNATLRAEDATLLEHFTELLDKKPLTYSFLT